MPGEMQVAEDLKEFLRHHIETYEQLEILRLLHRNRSELWSAELIAQHLRVAVPLVASALEGLFASALLLARRIPGERGLVYALTLDPVSETIARLVEVYEETPVAIIKLMSTNAIERVRTAALRTFADAFVLRKEKDKGNGNG